LRLPIREDAVSLTVTRLKALTRPSPESPDHPGNPKATAKPIALAPGLVIFAEMFVFMMTPPASLQSGLSAERQRTAARPRLAARTTRKKREPWEQS
jgi:hypothetical protein